VVDGTYNFSEPLVDWTWYIVAEGIDRPMTYHRLEDLEPDSFYELQVIAVNDLGRSDVDDSFIFSTAAHGVPAFFAMSSSCVLVTVKLLVNAHCPRHLLEHGPQNSGV